MKHYENDRTTKSLYNNYKNKRNKIFSGLSYEFDYEFGSIVENDENKDLSLENVRYHKRNSFKKTKEQSKNENNQTL